MSRRAQSIHNMLVIWAMGGLPVALVYALGTKQWLGAFAILFLWFSAFLIASFLVHKLSKKEKVVNRSVDTLLSGVDRKKYKLLDSLYMNFTATANNAIFFVIGAMIVLGYAKQSNESSAYLVVVISLVLALALVISSACFLVFYRIGVKNNPAESSALANHSPDERTKIRHYFADNAIKF